VAQNIGVAVARGDLEVAVLRREPAVLDRRDFQPPLAERERPRLLLAAVAGVALDGDRKNGQGSRQ